MEQTVFRRSVKFQNSSLSSPRDLNLLSKFVLYVFFMLLTWVLTASLLKFQLVGATVKSHDFYSRSKLLNITRSPGTNSSQHSTGTSSAISKDTKINSSILELHSNPSNPTGNFYLTKDVSEFSDSKSQINPNGLYLEAHHSILKDKVFDSNAKTNSRYPPVIPLVQSWKVGNKKNSDDGKFERRSPNKRDTEMKTKTISLQIGGSKSEEYHGGYREDPYMNFKSQTTEYVYKDTPQTNKKLPFHSGTSIANVYSLMKPHKPYPILMPSKTLKMQAKYSSKFKSPVVRRSQVNKEKNVTDITDSTRSSDPMAHDFHNTNHQMNQGNFPDIPTGQVDTMDKDIPGEPLTPKDFHNANFVKVYETVDTSVHIDPTVTAEEFEGDIVLVDEDKPTHNVTLLNNPNLRSGLVSNERLWPNGKIPYYISYTFDDRERAIIALAINNFHLVSCVRFIPRTNERDYIHFLKGDGCSSSVGRVKGSQEVSLGPGCVMTGVVMHELMHTLGFWHEQSRFDRDDYIRINWNNIQNGKTLHFQKYELRGLQHFGKQYDYSSLMHYSRFVFAKNRTVPTVEPRVTNHTVGQRKGLSETDSRRLRELYSCPDALPPSFITNVHQQAVTVPSVDPDLCEDTDYHCPGWAAAGECELNPAWMKVNCKVSCNECDTCEDLNPHCSEWAGIGQCNSNSPYMHLYCRRSCDECSYTGVAPILSKCQDLNKSCRKWVREGRCYDYQEFMNVFCKKSCEICKV